MSIVQNDNYLVNEYKLSFGLGVFISKIELRLIKILVNFYRTICNFFNKQYQNILNFFINHILNTHKLSLYSKITILISICLFLIKFISNLITSKSYTLARPSLCYYKFFNNQIIKNKTSLLDKKHNIKIFFNDNNWIKIKKFIDKRNKISEKVNSTALISTNKIIQEPFYRIMKFYIDYENNKNFKIQNKL
jgi:hypothetical protein